MHPNTHKWTSLANLRRRKGLLLMALPGISFFIIFHYLPLWGYLVSFKDYKPFIGFDASPWVGFSHYQRLLKEPVFWNVLANSLIINLLNLLLFFPTPIALALLLNEVRRRLFKSAIQTILYLPHFLSWVMIYGLTFLLFSSQGVINTQLADHQLGAIQVFLDPSLFRPTVILQQIWRDSGWGAIVILAALTSISPSLYEAAIIDGADRWQQFLYVTLPGIKGVIFILLVLRLGNLLRTGFEQIYIMQNPLNYGISDVLETYAFRVGILNADLGYATAVGVFQSVVAVVLVVAANATARRTGEASIW